MNVGIMSILSAITIGTIFLLLLAPGIFYYDTPSLSNSLNAIGSNLAGTGTTNSLGSTLFTPLKNNFGGNKNGTSGVNTSVSAYASAGFIFPAIGQIAGTILAAPNILEYLLTTTLYATGFPISVTGTLVTLLIGFVITILVLIFVSYWGKFDLLSR